MSGLFIPGLPPLPQTAQGFFKNQLIGLGGQLFSNVVNLLSAQPSWGIFLNGKAIATWDSVLSVDYQKDYSVEQYPIEQGSFNTYNKVEHSFDVRVTIARGGTQAERTAFIQAMKTAQASLNLYDVFVPEGHYANCSIVHVDYRRETKNGAGMIVMEVGLNEVRTTATTNYSGAALPAANVQNSGSADPAQVGQVQTSSLTSAMSNAVATVNTALTTALNSSVSGAVSSVIGALPAATGAAISTSIVGAVGPVVNGGMTMGAITDTVSAPVSNAINGAIAAYATAGTISTQVANAMNQAATNAVNSTVGGMAGMS